MYQVYQAKSILNVHKHCDGGWFWNKYSASPYLGCEYGCQYCYARDEEYNPHKASRDPEVLKFEDAFSQYIKVKENSPQLLRKALENKPRDLIYLDGYQPVEAKYKYARKMLEVCFELGFPVFINEKSPLLLRDLDLLKKINKRSYLNVGWSIATTKDDKARVAFEPKAPCVKSRFVAMKKLAENKIMTGTVFMPILPFIYDDEKNIESVVKETKKCGGKYVLDAGLTLWGYCKVHFYKALEKYRPSLTTDYDELYSNQKQFTCYTAHLHKQVLKYCKKYEITPFIPRPVSFYPEKLQLNKEIAGNFYLEARELQLSGSKGYREWAYRKAAWALDDLQENIEEIYHNEGIDGLRKIKGIGEKLAERIEGFLKVSKRNT